MNESASLLSIVGWLCATYEDRSIITQTATSDETDCPTNNQWEQQVQPTEYIALASRKYVHTDDDRDKPRI